MDVVPLKPVSPALVLELVADGLAAAVSEDGQSIKRARYYWLLLAEGHLNRRVFGEMLNRLEAL